MKNSLQFLKENPPKKEVGFLRLAKKEGNVTVSLGTKHLQIIKDAIGTKKNYITQREEKAIWYLFKDLDTGELVKYAVPIKDKKGNIHYLIKELGKLPENSLVNLTYKKRERGVGGYIEVKPVSETPDTDNIEAKKVIPTARNGKIEDKEVDEFYNDLPPLE